MIILDSVISGVSVSTLERKTPTVTAELVSESDTVSGLSGVSVSTLSTYRAGIRSNYPVLLFSIILITLPVIVIIVIFGVAMLIVIIGHWGLGTRPRPYAKYSNSN